MLCCAVLMMWAKLAVLVLVVFATAEAATVEVTPKKTHNHANPKNVKGRSRRVNGGQQGTSPNRKGQGAPASPRATIDGGEEMTANSGRPNTRRVAGNQLSPQETEITCDPPNSVKENGHCVYHCHETAFPSNDTRHTCVCSAHHEQDGVDEAGKTKCAIVGR